MRNLTMSSSLLNLKVAAVMTGIVALLITGLLVANEQAFLSVPLGQVEATVVRLQDGKPQAAKGAPPWFRYAVVLSDGQQAMFVSDHVHSPGVRLRATVSRGRITHRTWLGPPYVVLAEQPGAASR